MTDHKRALIIATSYGVETAEITQPKARLEKEGVDVTIATPSNEVIETLVMDKEAGPTVESNAFLSQMREADFDLLIIPGGTLNADTLRVDEQARALVQAFSSAGKPIAAICHAPWLVLDSGVAVGKTLTSFPSLRADANNAGANWVDAPVVVDDTNGFALITSRTPEDMDQFVSALNDQLA